MRAIILAGGRGTRLAPYTTVFPKPLVPIGDKPILEIIVHQLVAAGFTHITFTLGYLGELIRAFFAAHKSITGNIRIDYVDEETPTGTAGSLKLVHDLPESFLVMNGDVLCTMNYAEFMVHHRESMNILSIACHQKEIGIDLGVLEIDDRTGLVSGYVEKPRFSYPVSMGVYAYTREAVEHIPDGQYYDFPTLVLRLIASGRDVGVYQTDGIWLDIGRPEDYSIAQSIFAERYSDFLPNQ